MQTQPQVLPAPAMPSRGITRSKRMVSAAQLAKILGVSEGTVWRWARENKNFPRGLKLGPRLTRWDSDAIDAFLMAKTAEAAQ
jgi:predicted DNA-binding transcriptional regulator AlpA